MATDSETMDMTRPTVSITRVATEICRKTYTNYSASIITV